MRLIDSTVLIYAYDQASAIVSSHRIFPTFMLTNVVNPCRIGSSLKIQYVAI